MSARSFQFRNKPTSPVTNTPCPVTPFSVTHSPAASKPNRHLQKRLERAFHVLSVSYNDSSEEHTGAL